MRTGQISETCSKHTEILGRWVWELLLSTIGDEEVSTISSLDELGFTYPTQEEAEWAGRSAARAACDAITMKFDGKPCTQYYDMQTNQLRSWENH